MSILALIEAELLKGVLGGDTGYWVGGETGCWVGGDTGFWVGGETGC